MARLGETAIVAGAGIGGLASAAALSQHFDRVIVLDRDRLPDEAAPREGTPQARHTHVLLSGGHCALEALVPGFVDDLLVAGAVPLRAGRDVRLERPGFDPFPIRDLGWDVYALSRPLVERLLRRRIERLPNVEVRPCCRVESFVTGGRDAVVGLDFVDSRGESGRLAASFVVDATGRGAPTLKLLEQQGLAPPRETTIGIDRRYVTTVYRRPDEPGRGWLALIQAPQIPDTARAAIMMPLEGGYWMLTLTDRRTGEMPVDHAGCLSFLKSLRTRTLHDVLRDSEPAGPFVPFGMPESVRRHFDAVASFPGGLLPIGDAICRFNPVYGQGMSVAAQEARLLKSLLDVAQSADLETGDLARRFLADVERIVETPWALSAVPDLAYPDARGERPSDLALRLKFGSGLWKLAARDAEVHKLMVEVQHLLKPNTVFREPALARRVMAEMVG